MKYKYTLTIFTALLVFVFTIHAQLPAGADPNNLTRSYIASGDNNLKIGNFNVALADYTNAIQSSSTGGNGEALVKRALVLNLLGRSKEANEDLKQAAMLDKRFIQMYDSLTTGKMRRDSLATVSNPYENLNITNQPLDTTTFLDLGAARMGAESYNAAAGYFNAYLKKYPNDTVAIMYAAIAYTQMEKYDTALIYIKRSLAGKTELAYNNYGLYLYKRGFYMDAIEQFNKAIIANPAFSIAYFNRAICKKRLGNDRGYDEDFDKAIALATASANIYFNRAYYERVNGGESLANKYFDEATALNNSFNKSYLRTLPGKKFMTEFDDLQTEFKAKDTKDAEALYNEGVFAFLFGDYTLSIVDFSKAATLNPQNADYIFARGVARIIKDDTNMGCRDIKKAIELGVDRNAQEILEKFCK